MVISGPGPCRLGRLLLLLLLGLCLLLLLRVVLAFRAATRAVAHRVAGYATDRCAFRAALGARQPGGARPAPRSL